MKYKITKDMVTETAHRLLLHKGACNHVHGHSYKFRVTVGCNTLDDNGMVMDFSDLKKIMEKVIGRFDHTIVLNIEDPLIEAISKNVFMTIGISNGDPTAETFARTVYMDIEDRLKRDFRVHIVEVTVWETANNFATYGGDV